MKNYKVIAESELLDIEVNVNTIEEAQEAFNTYMEADDFYRIVATSNETGEILADCYRARKCGGVETIFWVAD
jgi:hypothetical protein